MQENKIGTLICSGDPCVYEVAVEYLKERFNLDGVALVKTEMPLLRVLTDKSSLMLVGAVISDLNSCLEVRNSSFLALLGRHKLPMDNEELLGRAIQSLEGYQLGVPVIGLWMETEEGPFKGKITKECMLGPEGELTWSIVF